MSIERPNDVDFLRSLPCWSSVIEITSVHGGMSNRNYLVSENGHNFFARIPLRNPAIQVDREAEVKISKAAFEAGLSPEVVYVAEGVMISRFIDGAKSLSIEAASDPAQRLKIVALVKRCHLELSDFVKGERPNFNVFEAIRRYYRTLVEYGSRRAHGLPRWLDICNQLEAAFGEGPLVFGHNDMLPANFLDDGNRLWLIDWEYGGLNSPYFDVGALIGNFGLDQGAADAVLTNYFGSNSDIHHRPLAIMTCATLMREFMWCLVAEGHSRIEFDYVSYSEDFIARFEKAHKALEIVL